MNMENPSNNVIENHWQATGEDRARGVPSPRAHDRFVAEGIPRTVGDDVDLEGRELPACGILVRALPDETGEVVGGAGGSPRG